MPIQNPSEAELQVLFDQLQASLPEEWVAEKHGGWRQRRFVRLLRKGASLSGSPRLDVGQCPDSPFPDRGLFFFGRHTDGPKEGRDYTLRTTFPTEHQQHTATVQQLAKVALEHVLPSFDAALAAAKDAAKTNPRLWR